MPLWQPLPDGPVITIPASSTNVPFTAPGGGRGGNLPTGFVVGGAAGFVSGTVIARMRVPSFIATLGMLNIAKGLALVISGLKPIYFNDTPEFNRLAMGSIAAGIPLLEVPNAVLVLFGAAIVASLILTRTVLGRYAFALGSNEEATRLSGVNVARWKIAIYTLAGVFSGLGGVLIAARLNSAQPSLGQGYELRVDCGLGAIDDGWIGKLRADFHDIHEREYSRRFEESDIEIPNIRVRGIGLMPKLQAPEVEHGPESPEAALRHEAEAWFRVGGTLGAVPTRYYDRGALKAGNRLEGPAIVNQYDSTTVIPPGLAGRVDRFGGIVIETGAASLADVLVAAVEEVEP